MKLSGAGMLIFPPFSPPPSQLKELDLSNCQLSSADLSMCPLLEILLVRGNRFVDADSTHVASCTRLKVVLEPLPGLIFFFWMSLSCSSLLDVRV